MEHSLGERAASIKPGWGGSLLRFAAPLAVGAVLAAAIHVLAERALGTFRAKIVLDIGINVILAVSLNLVNGFTGQFSIGHAGFMAVGGYAAGAITYYGAFLLYGSSIAPGPAGQVLFVLGCLAGGLLAAGAGYLVGLPSLRLRGDYLAIVTLGFAEILRVLLQLTWPVIDDAAALAKAPFPKFLLHLGGPLGFAGLSYYSSLFVVWCFVAITLVTAYRLKVSTWGRSFLSVRENEIAAEAMGVPTTKVKVRAFVVAAFFAGIAGGLFAHNVGTSLNPAELGFQKSFDVIIMVVLGGMGSVSGAVVAATILTILPEALRAAADYRMVIYALSLILMMILRPQGLFGVHEVWDHPLLERLRRRRKPA